MDNFSEGEIAKLQNNLALIRKAGKWSAEEFGDMIGVTKQTISNLENNKTTMTKTQYIAIRAILDYEMHTRPDDTVLSAAVNLAFNSEDLSETDVKKAQAFVGGAAETSLDNDSFIGGLTALVGAVAVGALIVPVSPVAAISVVGVWLADMLKKKK